MTTDPDLDALVERLADDARMGTLTTLDPSASDALVKYITAMRAERDALVGAAYADAADVARTRHEEWMEEDGMAADTCSRIATAILARTPADAAAAYEAAKREAYERGKADLLAQQAEARRGGELWASRGTE
jgi:hypothetical protein